MRIPQNQPFVPVILGGDIGAYSLARVFHEAYGTISVVVPSVVTGIVNHSNILVNRPYPDMTDGAGALAHLRSIAAEVNPASPAAGDGAGRPLLLLASADHLVEAIVRHREELAGDFIVPYPGADVIEAATLKHNFTALCEELGIDHPATVVYDVAAHPQPDLPVELHYPIIVKPADGPAWSRTKFDGKRKIHTAASRTELFELLDKIHDAGYRGRFILQDLIPGDDQGMRLVTIYSDQFAKVRFACYGEVVVEEHAPGAIGNSAGIMTGTDHGVVADAVRIAEHIGWTGFAIFDLKYDPRDGRSKFLELNPRLGRNHYYATAAGHNTSRYYVEEFLQGGLSGPEGLLEADEEHLYSVVPVPLLRRYATLPEKAAKLDRLVRLGKVSNPLVYKAEHDPRRWWYVALSAVNHFRKFARYYPAPAKRR